MAKKTKDEVVPKDPVQEMADKEISDFLGEEVIDGKVKEDREPEEVKEEPKKEEKVEEEEVDLDKIKEDIKKEVSDKISQETADKISKALKGEEATKEEKDKYQEYSEKFMAEKGRNPTWFELTAFLKEEVKQDLKAEQEAEKKRIEEETKSQEEAKKQSLDAFNKQLDEEVAELYAGNKLTKIKDANDPNDIGVKERIALLECMKDTNTKRVAEGKPPIYSISRIYNNYFTKPKFEPAGGDAPVSAGRGAPQGDSKELDYNEYRHKSFEQILQESMGK